MGKLSGADYARENDDAGGGAHDSGEAEKGAEIEASTGLSRFIDVETVALKVAALTWKDLQQTRKAFAARGANEQLVEAMQKIEQSAARQLSNAVRRHPLWPWLSQFPGLGGAHTAVEWKRLASVGSPAIDRNNGGGPR